MPIVELNYFMMIFICFILLFHHKNSIESCSLTLANLSFLSFSNLFAFSIFSQYFFYLFISQLV